jgi:non-homologous end joining protein Ku
VEKHDHDFEDIDLRDRFEAFMQEMVEEKNLREMLARSLEKAVERLTARLDKIRITDEIRASQKRQEVLAEVRTAALECVCCVCVCVECAASGMCVECA